MGAGRYFAHRVCMQCGDERAVQCGKNQAGGVLHRSCARCNGLATLARMPETRFTSTPRDDVDEMAVERIIGGDRKVGNVAERIEATIILVGKGLTADLVAARIGVSVRTVERYKREARKTGRLAHRLVDWSDKAAAA